MDQKDIKMYGIPWYEIDKIWFDIYPLVKEAIDRSMDGKYEPDDFYRFLLSRDMQLWVAYDDKGLCAIEITQIIKYPKKKVLMLALTAGRNSENWLHLVDHLKDFAKKSGCDSLEGYGRPGWEKLSKPLGFKKIHTIFKFNIS